MKRRWIYGLLLFSAFALLGAALVWFLGTESGTRWLFERVTRWSSSKIEARGVHGRLWDTVRLDDLRVALPDAEIRAQTIRLRWQPLHLLSGRIVVTELSLDGVQLQDRGTPVKKEQGFHWPHDRRDCVLASCRDSQGTSSAVRIPTWQGFSAHGG